MGRMKLQIKKIENTTNRQVTFSKRRNGLIKKAYELSVLCDVDVALILFSPSGRVTLFSRNKSIEEILQRYINLPEHERGRMQNQEYIQKALGKLKAEADQIYQSPSPMTTDSQLEELQRAIFVCKSKLEDMEKRLRIFEGEASQVKTLCEAEYREKILQEILKQVQLRKQVLVEELNCQVCKDGFVTGSWKDMGDWLPHGDLQVHEMLNFPENNGLAPLMMSDQQTHPAFDMLSPTASILLNAQDMDLDGHLMSLRPGGGLDPEDHNISTLRPQFGQVIDNSSSPWGQGILQGMDVYQLRRKGRTAN